MQGRSLTHVLVSLEVLQSFNPDPACMLLVHRGLRLYLLYSFLMFSIYRNDIRFDSVRSRCVEDIQWKALPSSYMNPQDEIPNLEIIWNLQTSFIFTLVLTLVGSNWVFPKIMVPPNHPLRNGVSIYFHHPFWGFTTPVFGNIHILYWC